MTTDTVKKGVLSSDLMVGTLFLGIVSLLIIPVPPKGLDFLLALSIGISTVVFLTSVFSERPTDFSVFPTLLLIATLLRLSLNVASTRLILLHGHEGQDAAGDVIAGFGHFVVGGNVGVGIILFLILVIINFVVITKGAGRTAEVSARFTLDALPGKQMAIDAELNSGTISDADARQRRAEIEQEADFYGAMDGASKFVRGDAIAGLIITGINLLGGIAIGISQQDMSLSDAASSYSILTVGDGLVSQLPALVVSTAAGIVISRASGRAAFGEDIVTQLLSGPRVMGMSAAFLILLGSFPGLPFLPFAVLGMILAFMAYRKMRQTSSVAVAVDDSVKAPVEPTMAQVLRVDPLALEIGYGLLPLVDSRRGGDVPDRVKKLRRQLAKELGIVIPPVRILDNLELKPNEYCLRLHGEEIARGESMPDRHLAIDSAGVQKFPSAIEVKEPVFGLPAFWILPEDRNRAEARGLTVVDPSTVIVTHLAELLRRNAGGLLGRDQVDELIGYIREEAPKLVDELIPAQLNLGEVVSVLQNLLEERVSIRNLRYILEALATTAPVSRNVRDLTEAVRAGLWRQITMQLTDTDGVIHAITLDRTSELVLRSSLSPTGVLAPEPTVFHNLVKKVGTAMQEVGSKGFTPCLVVAEDLRRAVYDLLNSHLPDLSIAALRELDRRAELRIEATISGIDAE